MFTLPPKIKLLGQRLVLMLLGCLLALVLLEIGVRIFSPQERALFRADPYIRTSHLPNINTVRKTTEYTAKIKTNPQGFVGNNFTIAKPPGTYRIATVGDSFTEAFQVNYDQSYSAVLEKNLNQSVAAARPFQVYNFGVSGFGTALELLTYQHYIRQYHPDLLVLQYYAGNDVTDDLLLASSPAAPQDYNGVWLGRLRAWLSNQLQSPRFILRRLEQSKAITDVLARYRIATRANDFYNQPGRYPFLFDIYNQSDQTVFKNAWSANCQTIKQFQAATTADGIPLLIVLIPHRFELFPADWQATLQQYPTMQTEKWDLDQPLRRARQCFQSADISYIDMQTIFRAKLAAGVPRMYYYSDDHFDANGHAIIADYLTKTVLNHLK